jgi:enoyl-CoA hydratase/carnithine racemase
VLFDVDDGVAQVRLNRPDGSNAIHAGATVALGRIVGHRRALDIALTNRVLIAEDALAAGLLTRVVADDRLAEESLALARSLAAGPTRALAATKHLLWDGLGRGLHDSLPYEARAQSEVSASRDATMSSMSRLATGSARNTASTSR